MLEEPKSNINFEIKKGFVYRYMGRDAEPKAYKKIGGRLTGFRAVTKDIKQQKIRYLYFYLNDPENGANYAVQTTLYKGAGPNIVRSLAWALHGNADITSQDVIIDVYSKEKNGINYTNATLTLGGQRLEWEAIPQGVQFENGIEQMVEEIAAAVKNTSASPAIADAENEPGSATYDEDSPDEGGYNPFARYANNS